MGSVRETSRWQMVETTSAGVFQRHIRGRVRSWQRPRTHPKLYELSITYIHNIIHHENLMNIFFFLIPICIVFCFWDVLSLSKLHLGLQELQRGQRGGATLPLGDVLECTHCTLPQVVHEDPENSEQTNGVKTSETLTRCDEIVQSPLRRTF